MTKTNRWTIGTALIGAGAMALPAAAFAQEAQIAGAANSQASQGQSDSADAGQLGDIIVTAQRRSENLQKVPIAITAFSAAAISENRISDLSGIATRVPGLTFSPFSPGQTIIALRGVSSNDDGAGTDNSVAVFVDDVYSGRITNINPAQFDTASVEVLRGPQGTLYGKNTIGGAISIKSTLPDLDRLNAQLQIGVGNYALREISGIISGPIGSNLAAKISFTDQEHDGYFYNALLHTRESDDNTQAVRGQLLYKSGDLQILLSADYNRLRARDNGRVPVTQLTGNLGPIVSSYLAICAPYGGYGSCTANPIDGFANRDAGGVSAKVDYDTKLGQLTSITAYRASLINGIMDSVGTPSFPSIGNNVHDLTHQISEEVRLSGGASSLKYVFGVFYVNEHIDRTREFDFGTYSASAGTVYLPDPSFSHQINTTNSIAAFGQIDWEFTPTVVLTVGGRYTYDHKSISDDSHAGNFPIIGQSFTHQGSAHWGKFTPKVQLSWHPDNSSTLYAGWTQGFKSGGFAASPTNLASTAPLAPESADSYEAGYKADFFDHTLRINADVFYAYYRNLQYQAFGPRPGIAEFGIFETTNLRSSRAYGAEAEIDWKPVRNLTLSANYGYLNSKYLNAIVPNADYPNQTGQQMIRAPKHKYSLSARYDASLGDRGNLVANLGYDFTGMQRGELEPYAIQPSFGLLDGRLGWTSSSGKLEIAVWGKNLTKDKYVAHVYTIGGEVIGTYGAPRTFGLTIKVKT